MNFSNLTSSHGGGGARNCAYEDMNAAPCENHAKHCNSVGQAGQCVTKGICCNPKGNNSTRSLIKPAPLYYYSIRTK